MNGRVNRILLLAALLAPGVTVGRRAQAQEVALPRDTTGALMSYTLNGKPFIVVPTGGANLPAELVVLSVP